MNRKITHTHTQPSQSRIIHLKKKICSFRSLYEMIFHDLRFRKLFNKPQKCAQAFDWPQNTILFVGIYRELIKAIQFTKME